MESQVRQSLADLEENLLENSSDFDFFQAFRILNRIQSFDLESSEAEQDLDYQDLDYKGIQVRPALNLGYSNAEVEAIEKTDAGRFDIVTNLAGLYGVASPLPDFMTEQLLDNEWEEVNGPREFLDLVQNQILGKLYQAWLLHKLSHNTIENDSQAYWNLLGSFLNNPELKADSGSEVGLNKLQYGGLFSLYSRSATALKTMLKHHLGLEAVKVNEYCYRRASIPEKCRIQLGVNNTVLGEDAHIGSVIDDKNTGVEIQVGPIPEKVYEEKLKSESQIEMLAKMVKDLLVQPYKVDLKIDVLPEQPGFVLGGSWNRLGENSYLGDGDSLADQALEINLGLC